MAYADGQTDCVLCGWSCSSLGSRIILELHSKLSLGRKQFLMTILCHFWDTRGILIHGGSIFFWRRSLKAWRHDDLCALIGIILIVLVLQKHCRYITEKQGWHNFACFCSFFRHQWTLVPACRLSWRRFPNLRACHLLCYKVESTCTAICACFSCSCCHTSKSRS